MSDKIIDSRTTLLDNDEIDSAEEGFMAGEEEAWEYEDEPEDDEKEDE